MMNKQSYSKKRGEAGEIIAEVALRNLNLRMVRKIETGWKVIRWIDIAKRIAIVVPNRAVMGDFTAITVSGKAVLVEVKSPGHNLRLSDFAPHQIETLNDFSIYGISLIVYVWDTGSAVLRWPIDGLVSGKSLSPDKAMEISINEPFN